MNPLAVTVARTRAELAAADRSDERPRAVVMTMGALHAGHVELIRAARRWVREHGPSGQVVVTIFVNPLQFGAGEDFDKYPRTFDDDVSVCAAEGVDVVFAPAHGEVYGEGQPQVTIDPGSLGRELEGAARPTHFGGVLTVVAKLLHLTKPDVAVFGEKDYQQLVLVRRMVTDLDFPVEIVGVPTVRESDGLAMSSRNRYLSQEQRVLARALSAALSAGAEAGDRGRAAVLEAAEAVLAAHSDLTIDYLALRTEDLAAEPTSGAARLLVAARLGETRLIDNVPVQLGASGPAARPDRR